MEGVKNTPLTPQRWMISGNPGPGLAQALCAMVRSPTLGCGVLGPPPLKQEWAASLRSQNGHFKGVERNGTGDAWREPLLNRRKVLRTPLFPPLTGSSPWRPSDRTPVPLVKGRSPPPECTLSPWGCSGQLSLSSTFRICAFHHINATSS